MASEEFAKLPKDEKKKFMDIAMSDHDKRREMFATRDKLSDTEKKQLRTNMRSGFRDHMKKCVEEYCKLPPNEREEYLDKMIDDREEMRQNRPPRNHERSDNPRRHREPRGDRMKQRLEGSTPTERAQRTQFMMDMRARMKARGIEPHHRGHR